MRVPAWLSVNGQKDITDILREKTKEVIQSYELGSGVVNIDNCTVCNGKKTYQFEGKAIVPFNREGIYLQDGQKVIYDRTKSEPHNILMKIVGDTYASLP